MDFNAFVKGKSNDLEKIEDNDYKKSINFLIEDENEAITGYDRIILLLENAELNKQEEYIEKLKFIRKQELEHIDILKNILEKLK